MYKRFYLSCDVTRDCCICALTAKAYDPPDPIDPPDAYDKTDYGKPYGDYKPPDYSKDYSKDYDKKPDYGKDYDIAYDKKPDYGKDIDYGKKPSYSTDYNKPPYGEDYDKKPDYGDDHPADYYPTKKPDYGTAYDKKPDYSYVHKPSDAYVPEPSPTCKEHNVCQKKGYKCCACADCTSDSFGCAETCACCPVVSILYASCLDYSYSTVALVPPMPTMDVWRGIT